MSGRPTTSSSRPYTANSRPGTAWTESEPPSTAHGPASYAYPTQQQYYANGQHNHLYVQEEEEEEESEDEDVFAYLPPGTAQSEAPPHLPHQTQFQQQQQQAQPNFQPQPPQQPPPAAVPSQSMSAAQLHNLVAAAGLDPGPSPPYTQSAQNSQHSAPRSLGSTSEHPGRRHAPETASSFDGNETGPNSYSMRAIPPSPGTFPPPTNFSINHSAGSREVRIDLPSHGGSFSSSYAPASPGGKHRMSSEPNTSVIDMTTTLKYTDDVGGPEEEEEDSPYPEVRASVSNTDDPEMPAMTLRMWICGIILCLIAIALNTFFNFRYPSPYLTPLVVLLIAYPCGKFLAYALPIRTIQLPAFMGGFEFSLNPGPFNIKEHVLIYMMANISGAPSYALNTIVASELYYGLDFGIGFAFTLVLSTQLTGLGLAGVCRRFLVWPASMVWPANLVNSTLLNTLHAEDDFDPRGGISRFRFFAYVIVGICAWTFLPGFLFQALSYFSWACFIAPNNLVVNQLFGTVSGLGMGVITFDWAQISWIGSPLMVPWWAQIHVMGGFVFFYWFLLPILYYSNVWNLAYMPMGGQTSYDRFGQPYDISKIFDPVSRSFNVTAYNEYSAMYLPGPYALVYLLAFGIASCVLVHTILYHGVSLVNGFKRIQVEQDDIHAKLMKNYPEVPDGWYASFVAFFFVLAIVSVEVWPTRMPVWALALSLLLPILYLLPTGFIYAVTGQGLAINLLAEIIPGTLLAGLPLPNMIFKAYSVQTIGAALSFTQDLKLGHYMKVPPRAAFYVQMFGGLLGAVAQVGIKEWLFNSVPDICSPTQRDHLICPHNGVYFTASAIWGLIGPTRQFGPGTLYHGHLYALIVGAFLPIPLWLWQKRNPKTRLRYVSVPVILNGPTYIPPARGINFSSWFLVGFIFQFYIRRRNFRWWAKFNYVLSAALDSGTIIAVVVIFLTLQLPFTSSESGSINVKWWGNTVFMKTVDFDPIAARQLAEGQAFDEAPNGIW